MAWEYDRCMKARYPGVCPACGCNIRHLEQIIRNAETLTWQHAVCPQREDGWPWVRAS